MKSAVIQLETLACPSCSLKIEKAVKALNGVDSASVKVMFNSSKVKLDFDEQKLTYEQIEKAISILGYNVKKTQIKDK